MLPHCHLFQNADCLRAAKVAALQDAPIPQFQGIGRRDCNEQKTQGGCGNKRAKRFIMIPLSDHDARGNPSALIIENSDQRIALLAVVILVLLMF